MNLNARLAKAEHETGGKDALPVFLWANEGEESAAVCAHYRREHPEHATARLLVFRWLSPNVAGVA